MSTASTPAPGRLLKMKDVERETSLHRATIYRRIAADEFPRPRPIGGGRVAWLESDIEAWKADVLANAN
ncbi:AlpA family transcriptional regulator [Altererythrobacter sp. B11]|nr:AlpA family transcriptional regulator [Altererythrobacter sp. B11]